MVLLGPDPAIEDAERDGPASGNDALEHHPNSQQEGLPRDQAVLGAGVEDGLEEAEAGPGDEDGEGADLNVAAPEVLPGVRLALPGDDGGGLEEEDEHDPEAVEAAEDVPEGALLDEAGLADAVLVGRDEEEVTGGVEGLAEAVEAVMVPKILIDVVVVAPDGVGGGAAAAGFNLILYGVVEWGHDTKKEGVLAEDGRQSGATGVLVDVFLEDAIEIHGHVVEDVGEAFRDEAEVGGLAPDEEIEGGVDEIMTAVGGGGAADDGVRDPDVGLVAQVGALVAVVVEDLTTKAVDDGGVEGADAVRRGLDAHLGIGEKEDEVLALVADVVALEAKENAELVQEVEAVVPVDNGSR